MAAKAAAASTAGAATQQGLGATGGATGPFAGLGATGGASLGISLDATQKGVKTDLTAKTTLGSGSAFTVTWAALNRFLFPEHLEHPESTGRLELFGAYGPTDCEGRLRGGIGGAHVHTDLEIRQMAKHNTRETLYDIHLPKSRSDVEVVVDALMPLALAHHYTPQEVKKLLRPVPRDENTGAMNFYAMQDIILASQRKRLDDLRKHGPVVKEYRPRVPFQSQSAHTLLAVTRKKKMTGGEEMLNVQKRLGTFGTCIATLEDQNLSRQLTSNVMLLRGPGGYHGSVDDRWDRYCALRRTGKSSYVTARNERKGFGCMDDGIADKHNNVSSLVSTGYHPLTRPHAG